MMKPLTELITINKDHCLGLKFKFVRLDDTHVKKLIDQSFDTYTNKAIY